MIGNRYWGEFKVAAAKQATERGHSEREVTERLGGSVHTMYAAN